MKKLQNDLTTPEQSKRLLELGVPADSANYYYQKTANFFGEWEYIPYIGESVAFKWDLFSYRKGYIIPCWSVGRLMEITYICDKKKIDIRIMDLCTNPNNTIMQQLIDILEYAIKLNDIDFSKLEE